MTYWFFHEYLDEARRFRVHRIEAATEADARKMHRQACEFRWVTQHVEPSVSSLFTRGEAGQRTLVRSHRPGDTYSTEWRYVSPPEGLLESIRDLGGSGEAALS